jgi:hypothetical protein
MRPAGWLHERAAALDEQDVAPAAVVLADAFPDTDGPEPGCPVQGQAGGILREDAGLDRPDPGSLGGGDQDVQQPDTAEAATQPGARVSKVALPSSIPAW